MESAKVRIRPLRFAFLVEPHDQASLLRVFEMNAALWGGVFNFIIPLFKRTPPRYRDHLYQQAIAAKTVLQGFVEAFQPDFLIETEAGQAASFGIDFPADRTGSIEELLERDEDQRCKIGVDLRSVCDDMYEHVFRFVQRHPPSVFIPSCTDKRFQLLFAAMFGSLPEDGRLGEVADVYLKALEGERKSFAAADFPSVFNPQSIFPLRVGRYKLVTHHFNAIHDGHLFYMDETSTWDLIEYWNYRALGWKILPLPVSIASSLTRFCEELMAANHRPYPPPSNAFQSTSYLCAYGQQPETVQAFLQTLQIPEGHFVSTNPHVPRVWEEWGRSADQARPQIVTHANKTTDAQEIGNGLHIDVLPHEFADDDPYCARRITSANVLESLSGAAPVIPWNRNVAAKLTYDFGQDKTWISREGITFFADDYPHNRYTRLPTATNVFSALAEASGFQFALSPAGRVCERIIKSVGGLGALSLVARSPELLKFLNGLAHETLEVDAEDTEEGPKRKKIPRAFASYGATIAAVRRSNPDHVEVADSHLSALIRCKVLKLGLRLHCTVCLETSWFSLDDLSMTVSCPRCLEKFFFPAGMPPDRTDWAYRVIGPFATYGYARGSYCVAASLHFIKEKIAHKTSWVPSFEMRKNGQQEFEADFGIFALQGVGSHISSPFLILGECKSFDRFQEKDFARARKAAALFPGAVIAFCTFNETLTKSEMAGIKPIVEAGRKQMDVGKQLNPVLILTARELFGQFKLGIFSNLYGDRSHYANTSFWRGEIDEICEFTQELYLGMPSRHEARQEERKKRQARKAARDAKRPIS